MATFTETVERDVTRRLATFRLWREMPLVDWPLSDCGERDVTCRLATFRLWRDRKLNMGRVRG